MDDTAGDYQFAKDRKSDRLYISRRFRHKSDEDFPISDVSDGTNCRFGHRVFPSDGMPNFVKEHGEVVLRTTQKGLQQVKAKFLEDDRRITHLWLQRWLVEKDRPMGVQIALRGDEIARLVEFLESISKLDIRTGGTVNPDFSDLRLVHLPDEEARKVLEEHPDLVAEFARSQITKEDVIALAYRREQLALFKNMLDRSDVTEGDWQTFFENNQWIFGYGLTFVFTTGFGGRSLEQTIRGANLIDYGKRPDGVMKTRAAISALCLVEIKKHNTDLLKHSSYRAGVWAPSNELSGAVAQTQENVRVALEQIGPHHRFTDDQGIPTGEELMTVQPRSFLVIGNLTEFKTNHGVNAERYRSFEDYRKNLRQPDIITFDELYERARFIVDRSDADTSLKNQQEDGSEMSF